MASVIRHSFEKLLVIITDVTARVEKERSDAEQSQLLSLFENIANDRGGFIDFLEEADRLVSALTSSQPRDQSQVLRDLHTLKGNFGLFALRPLAQLVHGLETACIEQQSPLTQTQQASLRAAWQRFRDRAGAFLGQHPNSLVVEREELEALAAALRRGVVVGEQAARMVDRLCDEPVEPKLARMAQRAKGLAQRLGKGDIDVAIEAHGVRAAHGLSWLWALLPHAINNSIDHGLPDRADGQQSGGRLRLGAAEREGTLRVEVEDNGRGIDWEKVRAKGRALGLPVTDQAALVDVVFAQGVSTRDEVSEVSGRGVGLAAVKEACQAHGATLQLESQPGRGALLRVIAKLPVANSNAKQPLKRTS